MRLGVEAEIEHHVIGKADQALLRQVSASSHKPTTSASRTIALAAEAPTIPYFAHKRRKSAPVVNIGAAVSIVLLSKSTKSLPLTTRGLVGTWMGTPVTARSCRASFCSG